MRLLRAKRLRSSPEPATCWLLAAALGLLYLTQNYGKDDRYEKQTTDFSCLDCTSGCAPIAN
jgi:hypothetical protein